MMEISWTLKKIESPRTSLRNSISSIEDKFHAELYFNPQLEKYLRTIVSSLLIDLSYCNLIDADVSIIVKKIFPSEQNDRILDLSGNRLTSQGATILARHLSKYPSIKILDLSFNRLSNCGVRPMVEIFTENPPTSLRKLFLNKNGISNDDARYLAHLLRTNPTLEELWLSDNEIGDAGVEQLAHAIAYSNKTLKVLVLSSNIFISDRSLDFFNKLIKYNRTLEKLFLRDCSFTEIGKDTLANEVRLKKNFHLDI